MVALATALSIVGGLAAISSTAAAWIGLHNRKRINEIHVMVNSRLDSTLAEIADLKQQRDNPR